MGKAKEERIDSDYSGRPTGRPTPKEVAEGIWSAPADFISAQLADGTFVNEGPDGRLYYEHFDGYRPIWDRPVDPKDYPEGWRRGPVRTDRQVRDREAEERS